jgi:MFS family permease
LQLGVISLVGLLASSLTYPISGVVGDAYYRGRIILWSLIGIAATTVMIALVYVNMYSDTPWNIHYIQIDTAAHQDAAI